MTHLSRKKEACTECLSPGFWYPITSPPWFLNKMYLTRRWQCYRNRSVWRTTQCHSSRKISKLFLFHMAASHWSVATDLQKQPSNCPARRVFGCFFLFNTNINFSFCCNFFVFCFQISFINSRLDGTLIMTGVIMRVSQISLGD